MLYDDAIRGVLDGTTLTADFGDDGTRRRARPAATRSPGPYEVRRRGAAHRPAGVHAQGLPEPEGVDAQERGYLAALASVVRFEQAGPKLTLFNAKGQMAVTLARPR